MAETGDTANPTNALVSGDTVACWTCGSTVDEGQIQETLDDLRELRSRHLEERGDIQSRIAELSNKKSDVRDKQSEIEQSNCRLSEIDEEIDRTKRRIRSIEKNIEKKEREIRNLEAEAEEIDVEDHEETLQLYREANKLELQIERLRSEVSEIEEEIVDKEEAIEKKDELEAEHEEIGDQLTELRTRIDRIEEDAISAFNDNMETILDLLGYENIERIWIERREVDVREGREKVIQTRFELHIVRVGESGSVYKDSIDHLSESEREVTGLIFALAGYLVHDVHEEVPVIILDSLEAIDSNRIARVIGYFRQYTDYLIAALLSEDAEALQEEYTYVEKVGRSDTGHFDSAGES